MLARRMCRMALRLWMGQLLLLGLSCHFYSPSRGRLVHSRYLQVYKWLQMAIHLVMYWGYKDYSRGFFPKGTFHRQGFVLQVSDINVGLQLCSLVVQDILSVLYERRVCQLYNELAGILRKDLDQSRSRFYYWAFFVKFHNYLHNFNIVFSLLMISGIRTMSTEDYLAHIYYVYNLVARESVLFFYVLILLDLGEALRLNSDQEQETGSYEELRRQLRRQERLMGIGQEVHRIFGLHVATTIVLQLFFNTGSIYLGYAFFNHPPNAMEWNPRLQAARIITLLMSLVVKLSDCLLLQIVCEHLIKQENRICACPLTEGTRDSKAIQRQWEMSLLRRAIRRQSPPNKVLGLFRMDMRCAFALISSSLSYGIIIIQLGYVHI
ncbi:hypothetical protein KR009_011215 [Drosophila setifemur]|nr:hypothetical protein KR009_011215 [Drosophila setifemur]